jgi:periplasmic protein TonB
LISTKIIKRLSAAALFLVSVASCANHSGDIANDREALAYGRMMLGMLATRSRAALLPEGRGLVRFTLFPSGDVGEIEIARSSGLVELDASAIEMVRQTAPFPPPPARLRRSEGMKVTVQFRFDPRRDSEDEI